MRKILLVCALLCALLVITSCDKLKIIALEITTHFISEPEIDPAETVNLIRKHLENHTSLKTYAWLYRTVYTVDGNYFAIIDFPKNARYAPTYPQLLALCPNPTESHFWIQSEAKSFLLYLTRPGKKNAIQIARCIKDIQHPGNKNTPKPDTPPIIYPPENADLALLKKAAAEGSPSFNDAKIAINANDMGLLQKYLLKRPELALLYDETGQTLLSDANRLDEIMILMAFGAEANIQLRDGETILTRVTGNSSLRTVTQFVELGANPKYCRPEESFAPESAEFLLKNGAPISSDALSNAMGNGKFDIADILYQRGARLETTEFYKKNGLILLHKEIEHILLIIDNKYFDYYLKVAETYIRYTENIQAVDKSGKTVLEMTQASESIGKEAIIKLLRKRIAEDAAKKKGINELGKAS
jgi:hypothetical protein